MQGREAGGGERRVGGIGGEKENGLPSCVHKTVLEANTLWDSLGQKRCKVI